MASLTKRGKNCMVSLDSARKLKQAGLDWQPSKGDWFVVPDRGMDEQVFTINDMAVIIESLKGYPAITFHGTPEWALDYVFVGEAVWLPTEDQLRSYLEKQLKDAGSQIFDLLYIDREYTCRFEWQGEAVAFRAPDASEAYAAAVLHVLTA
jgi:hypothetical protein